MTFTTFSPSNVVLKAVLRAVALVSLLVAAMFFASAGYGLLKMLRPAMSGAANIGIAEFFTHSGLTVAFFALAGFCAYLAKKCCW